MTFSLRSISFGDPTAEADATFLFDRQCFLETDIYQRCLEMQAPLFVVGRRGSGKSATRMALTRQFALDSTKLVVVISPQGFHFAHAKALARAMMRDTDINWEFLFTSVWASTLRGAWAEALVNYYKVRDTDRGDLKLLQEFVHDVVEPDSMPEQRVSQYMKRAADVISSGSKDIVGDIQVLLQSIRAERIGPSIRRVAETSGVRLITLIDGLARMRSRSSEVSLTSSWERSECFGSTSSSEGSRSTWRLAGTLPWRRSFRSPTPIRKRCSTFCWGSASWESD
jgi:hypothetical protein